MWAAIPEQLYHFNLTGLDLRGNRITHLPVELTQLKYLEQLFVDGNPLVEPPVEIAVEGSEAILTPTLGAISMWYLYQGTF